MTRHSLQEGSGLSRGAVDVDHEGSKSCSAIHHVFFQRSNVLVNVGLVGVLAFHEVYKREKDCEKLSGSLMSLTWVNIFDRKLVALVGPLLELAFEDFSGFSWEARA